MITNDDKTTEKGRLWLLVLFVFIDFENGIQRNCNNYIGDRLKTIGHTPQLSSKLHGPQYFCPCPSVSESIRKFLFVFVPCPFVQCNLLSWATNILIEEVNSFCPLISAYNGVNDDNCCIAWQFEPF